MQFWTCPEICEISGLDRLSFSDQSGREGKRKWREGPQFTRSGRNIGTASPILASDPLLCFRSLFTEPSEIQSYVKRHEKRKLENDRRVDRLLQTEYGRSSYWEILLQACRRDSMIALLESTLRLPGAVIECGVYRGNSLQMICRAVAGSSPEKRIFACDSFEGFPRKKVGRIDRGTHWILSRVRRKYRFCQDTPARLERFFETFKIDGRIVKGFFSGNPQTVI